MDTKQGSPYYGRMKPLFRNLGILVICISPISIQANEVDWKNYAPDPSSICKGSEARSDFDGNGKQDVARLQENKKTHHRRLAVWMNGSSKPLVLVEGDIDKAGNFIGLANPGGITPFQGEETDAKPTKVKIEFHSISYGTCESSQEIFYWNKSIGKFQEVWISD